MSKSKIRNERGITLVALIITIIVLIILAAVTIKTVFDSNFLKVATEGTENYAKEQEYEEEIMKNLSDFAEGVAKNIANIDGGSGTPEQPEEPEIPEGWEGDKVYPVESEDGIDVPVPKGFVASKATGEKKVNDGFVIYQGTEDVTDENVDEARTSRNQFVWVPVEDPSEMFGTDADGNSLGKLYDFGSKNRPKNPPTSQNWTETDGVMKWTSNTGRREPDIITGENTGTNCDTVGSNYTSAGIEGITNDKQFKEQLQSEFEQMRKSVEKYHGFYIGRYETGDLSKTKVVCVKGNNDIGGQNWYRQYQKIKGITEGTSAISSMIWGCQWDATMKWFLKDSSVEGYINNSEIGGNANFTGSKSTTGSKEVYGVKNIYDMSGNMLDWTLEAESTYNRQSRGGHYLGPGTYEFASCRYGETPAKGNIYDGSRSMLVI